MLHFFAKSALVDCSFSNQFSTHALLWALHRKYIMRKISFIMLFHLQIKASFMNDERDFFTFLSGIRRKLIFQTALRQAPVNNCRNGTETNYSDYWDCIDIEKKKRTTSISINAANVPKPQGESVRGSLRACGPKRLSMRTFWLVLTETLSA